MQNGQVHHIEYYVDDLERTAEFWGWFFSLIGWSHRSTWSEGVDWVHPNGTYLVFVKTQEAHRGNPNNRQATGLNHLAFRYELVGTQEELVQQLIDRGAKILYNEENYLCFEELNRFAVELYLD